MTLRSMRSIDFDFLNHKAILRGIPAMRAPNHVTTQLRLQQIVLTTRGFRIVPLRVKLDQSASI
jgi:hypothetical protein